MTSPIGRWGIINPFSKARRMRAISSIRTLEVFRDVLERERVRAERPGQEFSVVVFDASRQNGAAVACLKDLAHALASRVRASDEVGWFSDKSIGVALPATSAEGAWKFADDVSSSADSSISLDRPSLQAMSYDSLAPSPTPGASPTTMNRPSRSSNASGASPKSIPAKR